MKINKKYKYWEFYFDEENDENKKQCIGSIWSDEWSGLELLKYNDEKLRDHLMEDIDDKRKYTGEKVNKGLIKHAIAEMKKIKLEIGFQ